MKINVAGLAGSAVMLLFIALVVATKGMFMVYVMMVVIVGFLAMIGYSLGNFLFGPKEKHK